MSIHEYSVPDDFFQVDGLQAVDGLGFPCIVCRHKNKDQNSMPCKFCGHNDGAEDHFNCCLCGEIQAGTPQDGKYLAVRTLAEIGPMCLTCCNTITAPDKNKNCNEHTKKVQAWECGKCRSTIGINFSECHICQTPRKP